MKLILKYMCVDRQNTGLEIVKCEQLVEYGTSKNFYSIQKYPSTDIVFDQLTVSNRSVIVFQQYKVIEPFEFFSY